MDLVDQLRDALEQHVEELPAHAWASESDRWAELVFCLLQQCAGGDATKARHAVDVLDSLGMLEIRSLAALADDDSVLIDLVLRRCGFSAGQSKTSVSVLAHAASAVQSGLGGKIQRLVRKHGEVLRDQLTAMLEESGLAKADLRYAVGQWLQNTLSLPISLESAAVTAFCRANEASLRDLQEAADALDLNVALVDDLLELAQPVEVVTRVKRGSPRRRR